MQKIQTSNYPIIFREGISKSLEEYFNTQTITKVFVLVDENTKRDCLPIFKTLLPQGLSFETLEVTSGEENKHIETLMHIWNELTEKQADRKILLINLGGGVATDMGGFAASCFKRGVKFIHVPTTLLNMVDASIGGKTGVDFKSFKNHIGAFVNPEMVLMEPKFLETLERKEWVSGFAEVIKYAITLDSELYDFIQKYPDFTEEEVEFIIHRSASLKVKVVEEDFKESGLRKVLNFGHTIGHAIESHYLESKEKQRLLHGEAIAIGMICESFIAHKLCDFSEKELKEITSYILSVYPKVNLEEKDFEDFLIRMIQDKKNTSGKINCSLVSAIGKYALDVYPDKEIILESLDFYKNL